MAWYDEFSAGVLAVGAAITAVIVGVGGQMLKTRRTLAEDNNKIAQVRSETRAAGWLNEDLVAQVKQARDERDATMRAAKELLDQRMLDVEKMARQEEKLSNCERQATVCEDRAHRAEGRAAVAEEHMRKQAEQMLVQSMNIDRLTTALAAHDPEEAKRLTPTPKTQPLLDPPDLGPTPS